MTCHRNDANWNNSRMPIETIQSIPATNYRYFTRDENSDTTYRGICTRTCCPLFCCICLISAWVIQVIHTPLSSGCFIGIEVMEGLSQCQWCAVKHLIWGAPNPKTLFFSFRCLFPNHRSKVFSREGRCSWSSADNYIWVVNSFIAY